MTNTPLSPKDVAELRKSVQLAVEKRDKIGQIGFLLNISPIGLTKLSAALALASQSIEREGEIERLHKLAAARLTAIETYRAEIACLKAGASGIKRAAIEECGASEMLGALRFILAFYEPGQRYLDTEAWKRAEAQGRAAAAQAESFLAQQPPAGEKE